MPLSDLRQGRKCDTERIVAIHDDERGEVTLFIREGTEVHQQRCETPYWLLVSDPRLLEGTTVEHQVEELASGELKYLVTCVTLGKLENLRLQIVAKYNTIHSKNLEPYEWYKIPDLYYERSLETQFMLRSGVLLFGSMECADLRRLQLHVCALLPLGEALCDPEHPEGKIVAVSVSDRTKVIGPALYGRNHDV